MSDSRPCATCARYVWSTDLHPPRAQCWRCRRTTPLPRLCVDCGVNIDARGAQAHYCVPCSRKRNTTRDRQQRRERYAREQRRKWASPVDASLYAAYDAADMAPRDPAIEAAIEAHLVAIRASRKHRLTDDIIWARRTDLVAQNAPEAV